MMGPVQLMAIGFADAHLEGRVVVELERLSQAGVVRILDAVAIHKNADGEVRTTHFSDLSEAEVRDVGGPVRTLLGLAGEESNGHLIGVPEVAAKVGEIPRGTAVGVALLEHTWAIPLRTAIEKSGGTLIGDEWVRQDALTAAGLAPDERTTATS